MGQALKSWVLGVLPLVWLAQGCVFMPVPGASEGLTRALTCAPILTPLHPAPLGEDPQSQGFAKPASFPKPARKTGQSSALTPLSILHSGTSPSTSTGGGFQDHGITTIPSPSREAAVGTVAGSGVPGAVGSPPQTPGTCQTQGFESRWLSYFLPL